MDRREYLATVAATGLISVSGCAEADTIVDTLGGSHTTGKKQSFEGVEFTPTKYVLTDSMSRNFEMNSNSVDASQGATFILTHLSVVHKGDSEQQFPQVQTTNDVRLYYDEDRVTSSMMDDAAQSYTVDGETLTSYGTALREKEATHGVYPGTEVDGWIVHEIASNFDPEKLELHVIWNNQPLMEGEETQKWTYTEDSETAIDDVEEGNTLTEI